MVGGGFDRGPAAPRSSADGDPHYAWHAWGKIFRAGARESGLEVVDHRTEAAEPHPGTEVTYTHSQERPSHVPAHDHPLHPHSRPARVGWVSALLQLRPP